MQRALPYADFARKVSLQAVAVFDSQLPILTFVLATLIPDFDQLSDLFGHLCHCVLLGIKTSPRG